jgi:hypothetical protein
MQNGYTGEGFPNEKTLAIVGVVIGVLTLAVITLDHMDSASHRKVAKELAQAQLNEIKKKNGGQS